MSWGSRDCGAAPGQPCRTRGYPAAGEWPAPHPGPAQVWVAALGEAPAAVGFVRRLRAALRRSAPDLIHSNGLKTHVFAAVARPRGVPVLWHLHDFLSQHPVMVRLLRRLTLGVAGGIATSEAVLRDAEAVLPGLPISLVLHAIDTDHFAPANRDGAELDRLAGLEPAGPGVVRVGLVATYANWKGQDVFLDALARLSATGPPVRGYIVGGPIYATAGSQFTRDELERRAAANGLAGRVGFIPFQPGPVEAVPGCSTWRSTPAPGPSRSGGRSSSRWAAASRLWSPRLAGRRSCSPPATTGSATSPATRPGWPARSPGWPPTRGCGPALGRTPGGRWSSGFRKNGTGGRSQQSTSPAAGTGSSLARGRGSGEERQPGLLRREATRFSMSPPLQAQAGRARKLKGVSCSRLISANRSRRAPSPTGAPSRSKRQKEIQNRKAFSWNETKKETPFCINSAELDKERDVVGIALQMHVTAAEFRHSSLISTGFSRNLS